jgi:hypothetical protein
VLFAPLNPKTLESVKCAGRSFENEKRGQEKYDDTCRRLTALARPIRQKCRCLRQASAARAETSLAGGTLAVVGEERGGCVEYAQAVAGHEGRHVGVVVADVESHAKFSGFE